MADSKTSPPVNNTSDFVRSTNVWDDFAVVMKRAQDAREAYDDRRAHTFYARATELNANDTKAWAGRGSTATNLSDAVISWGYALALAPTNPAARMGLDQSVRNMLEQSDQAQPATLIKLGIALAECGQRPWAHLLFVRTTDLDDTDEQAWLWRAGLSENSQEAISCLNHALALNPDNERAQEGLKWVLEKQIGATPAGAPEDVARLLEEGHAKLLAGDRFAAHTNFKRATEVDPKNEAAWLWNGSTTSDVDEALASMEQVLSINPNNQTAKEARSWLRVQKLRQTVKPPASYVPPRKLIRTEMSTAPTSQHRFARVIILVLAVMILFGFLLILLARTLLR